MPEGVIYILTNPSYPEYVKIGFADDLAKRLKQLNRSEAIPFAFRAYATYEVDHKLTDKKLHKLIDDLNPDLRSIENFAGKKRTKEFFAMSPEEAYAILEAIAEISGTTDRLHRVTPTGQEIKDSETADEIKQEAKRGPFKFSMVDIEPGDMVTFLDDPSITAEVVDDRHIRLGNEVTTLSAAAEHLLDKQSLPGPKHWTYAGEVLAKLRDERGL